jgi:hypothetical protein
MPTLAGVEPPPAGLQAARSRLRAFYDEANGVPASRPVAALLFAPCDIIEADEATVVFGFKFPAHADRAATKPNMDTLSDIVSRVMGRPLTVRCVHDPSVEAWTQRDPANRSRLVRSAVEQGARVISPGPEGIA